MHGKSVLIFHFKGNAKIVAQTLMEKLLEIEETEDAVQTAQAPAAAAEKTTPTQQTAKPKGSLSSEGTKGTCASNTEGNSKKGKDSGSIKAKSQRNGEHNKTLLYHIVMSKMYCFFIFVSF